MKNFVSSAFSILLTLHLYSQDFESTFQKYSQNYVPDRIHIQFDKTIYGAGDTIWYKGYLLNALQPVTESKNFYIDWTDGNGELIQRSVSPIVSGITFGQIAIPADYQDGYIHAKAYTKWMLNFDPTMLFDKDIRVLSDSNKRQSTSVPVASITFFPEGGHLIKNLVNKIAFKISDQYGRPVEGSCILMVDGKATEKFRTLHDGMGFFFMRPEPGKKYSVAWSDEQLRDHNDDLPPAVDEGIAMQIGLMPGSRSFIINASDSFASRSVRMIGTMFGKPVFDIIRTAENGLIQGVIPVNTLPTGILRVTVLDAKYHPLAERITFINNHDFQVDTRMEVMHRGLTKRACNEIEISIPDSLSANISVSVTDSRIDFDTTYGIFSDLLLTSELKGKINNPAFYFQNADDNEALLDLVMLTNGWRKISWKDLAADQLPEIKFPKDSTYLTISGKVYGANAAQFQKAGDLVLIVNQDKNSEWMITPIHPDGSFSAKNYLVFDTALVFYQVPKGLKKISVAFKNDPLPGTISGVRAGMGISMDTVIPGLHRQLLFSRELQSELNSFRGKVLSEIKIKKKIINPKQLLNDRYTSNFFVGGNSKSLDVRNNPSASAAINFFYYLVGKLAGVDVSTDEPLGVSLRGRPLALFLNQVPIPADVLATIPVSEIAYIKIIYPFVLSIGDGYYGAVSVYTRKGEDIIYDSKGLSKNTVTGYSVIRQFYSPDYEQMSSDKKDLRTTLYWNPEVILGPGKNKAVLKFFNNDVSESFRVVIEGMTPDGKLTRLVRMME